MNYLANNVQAEKFIEENHHFIIDVLIDEGHPQMKKGILSIDVNEDYEIIGFGFQKVGRRRNKYIKINSAPVIKNSSKKVCPVYVQINYEGDLWWCMKKFINVNEFNTRSCHIHVIIV